MQVQFINPFVESLLNVLQTMAQLEARPSRPFLKQEEHDAAVTGFISMEGGEAVCTLAIRFSEAAILKVGSAMLGEEVTEVNDEMADLVGEVTNMVTGSTKKILWEKGFNFELSRPRIFLKEVDYEHVLPNKVVVVPFSSDYGEFLIEACMKDKRQRARVGAFAS